MYSWVKLSSVKWVDAWEERFAGNQNLLIEYIKGGKSVRLQYFTTDENEVKNIVEQFGGAYKKVNVDEIHKPAELPRPVKVRDVILVTAATQETELQALQQLHPKRQLISIPPELAFGTGDHETTSTCLRLLVDISRKRKNTSWTVADLGTGTGLLAIAAKKLKCGPCFACDFDPFAVKISAKNAQRNGTPDIDIQEQDVLKWSPPAQGYDVVLANLFSTVLIEAWPVIAKSVAPEGDLIVSGILYTQAWDVFTAAAKSGLGFTKVIKKGKWITAHGGHFKHLISQENTQP